MTSLNRLLRGALIACFLTVGLAANLAYAQQQHPNPYRLGDDGRCFSPTGEAVSRDWCVPPDPVPYKLGADGKCHSPNGSVGLDEKCLPRDPRLPPLPYKTDAAGQCRAADGQLVLQRSCPPQPVSPGPWKLSGSGQCLAKDGEPVMMQFCQTPAAPATIRAQAVPPPSSAAPIYQQGTQVGTVTGFAIKDQGSATAINIETGPDFNRFANFDYRGYTLLLRRADTAHIVMNGPSKLVGITFRDVSLKIVRPPSVDSVQK